MTEKYKNGLMHWYLFIFKQENDKYIGILLISICSQLYIDV